MMFFSFPYRYTLIRRWMCIKIIHNSIRTINEPISLSETLRMFLILFTSSSMPQIDFVHDYSFRLLPESSIRKDFLNSRATSDFRWWVKIPARILRMSLFIEGWLASGSLWMFANCSAPKAFNGSSIITIELHTRKERSCTLFHISFLRQGSYPLDRPQEINLL